MTISICSPGNDIRGETHHERADERGDLFGGPQPPLLLLIQAFLSHTAKAHMVVAWSDTCRRGGTVLRGCEGSTDAFLLLFPRSTEVMVHSAHRYRKAVDPIRKDSK